MKDQINTVREALEFIDGLKTGGLIQGRTREALTALTELEAMVGGQEFALPETPFQEVAPGIEVGYDLFGGVDIRLGGEFVYVHINYDHRYTHNAARARLADQIVGLLTGAAPVAQQQQYDQTALELCAVCGWKTLIPGDCCLNCERNKAQQPQSDLLAAAKEFCRKVEAGEARSTTSYAAFKSAIEQIEKQPQAEKRCQYCDGTGDVHSIDGQWRGECHCQKQPQAEPDWINGVPHWSPALVAKVKQMTAELDEPKQPQVEAVPAWTTEQITAVAQPIAMAIAENCRTAPQLVFPHLFLGLKDLLTSTEPQQAEAVPGDVTDAMVDAYLKANDAYWRETDTQPKSPAKWRNGNPKEATRVSLAAAIAQQKGGV